MNSKITIWGFNAFFAIILSFFQITLYSQSVIFKGIVKDEQTLKPIPDVNIKIFETTQGTATDKNGQFSIKLEKIPAAIVFTCVGYENEYYKISEISKNPVEFLLRSKAYTLKEVNITSRNYSFIFKNQDYSVLDYELMDDNILLMVFRTLLKQSQAILLNRFGDTIAVSQLPELPPSRFYKDFLSNIHYFSKSDNSYQCYYKKATKSIDFLFKTKIDSIEKLVKPFLFKIQGRLYFQESYANGFGTVLGYYEKGRGKQYIGKFLNEGKNTEFSDDQIFYTKWNAFIAGAANIPIENFEGDSRFYNSDEARAHSFEYFNMTFPVIKTNDTTIVFFNFGENVIDFMNKDGKISRIVPISFHKETVTNSDTISKVRLSDSGWHWGNVILVDEFNHNVYTTYHKIGMIRINRIDIETGQLKNGTIIPLPFPEKIEIYDGEAYFLNKGVNENWKLAKCDL